MNNKYLLFRLNRAAIQNIKTEEDYNIKCFSFRPWKLKLDGKKASFREYLFRFYISILTFGNVKIYYIEDENGRIIHSNHIIGRNFKYPFLKKNQAATGPANTASDYRGKGLHPYVASYIVKDNPDLDIYCFIREDNIASIKGVTKIGFEMCKEKIGTTSILNRFYIIKE